MENCVWIFNTRSPTRINNPCWRKVVSCVKAIGCRWTVDFKVATREWSQYSSITNTVLFTFWQTNNEQTTNLFLQQLQRSFILWFKKSHKMQLCNISTFPHWFLPSPFTLSLSLSRFLLVFHDCNKVNFSMVKTTTQNDKKGCKKK